MDADPIVQKRFVDRKKSQNFTNVAQPMSTNSASLNGAFRKKAETQLSNSQPATRKRKQSNMTTL